MNHLGSGTVKAMAPGRETKKSLSERSRNPCDPVRLAGKIGKKGKKIHKGIKGGPDEGGRSA